MKRTVIALFIIVFVLGCTATQYSFEQGLLDIKAIEHSHNITVNSTPMELTFLKTDLQNLKQGITDGKTATALNLLADFRIYLLDAQINSYYGREKLSSVVYCNQTDELNEGIAYLNMFVGNTTAAIDKANLFVKEFPTYVGLTNMNESTVSELNMRIFEIQELIAEAEENFETDCQN